MLFSSPFWHFEYPSVDPSFGLHQKRCVCGRLFPCSLFYYCLKSSMG
jgi:hypothetical protein